MLRLSLRPNKYPKTIKEWGARSYFKRACENFNQKWIIILYKRLCVVVMAKQQQSEIIKDVHEGVGQCTNSKPMASHKG